jgi:hypothetical protein
MFDCFFSCHRSVKEYLARKKVIDDGEMGGKFNFEHLRRREDFWNFDWFIVQFERGSCFWGREILEGIVVRSFRDKCWKELSDLISFNCLEIWSVEESEDSPENFPWIFEGVLSALEFLKLKFSGCYDEKSLPSLRMFHKISKSNLNSTHSFS